MAPNGLATRRSTKELGRRSLCYRAFIIFIETVSKSVSVIE